MTWCTYLCVIFLVFIPWAWAVRITSVYYLAHPPVMMTRWYYHWSILYKAFHLLFCLIALFIPLLLVCSRWKHYLLFVSPCDCQINSKSGHVYLVVPWLLSSYSNFLPGPGSLPRALWAWIVCLSCRWCSPGWYDPVRTGVLLSLIASMNRVYWCGLCGLSSHLPLLVCFCWYVFLFFRLHRKAFNCVLF